ncbi:MAG TPA: hypothetical protein PKH65_03485 [Bacteroidia bacterium]|nr:hypothetical protein [Bacteroidia bacterium]HNT79721.1 hypothetical protein [Bacteroidia bacterium]
MQKSFNNSDKNFKQIHSLIESLNEKDKEVLTDKLLSYLLFSSSSINHDASDGLDSSKHDLTDYERELLRKLSEKTEELYRRMGGDFLY